MSATGSTKVTCNPYGLGTGLHGRIRLSGLGDDTDYGIAARQAALSRAQSDRLQHLQDQQDAQQRADERQKVLETAQKAVDRAAYSQINILTSGQNQLRRLLAVGGLIGVISIVTLGATSVFGKDRSKKTSRSWSRRGSSRKSKKRWSPRTKSAPLVESFS